MGLILDLITAAAVSQRPQPPAQTTAPVVYDPVYSTHQGTYVRARHGRVTRRRFLRDQQMAYLTQAMAPTSMPPAPQHYPAGYYGPPNQYQPYPQQPLGQVEHPPQYPIGRQRGIYEEQPQQETRGGIENASHNSSVHMGGQGPREEPPSYEVAKKQK